jgi:hypothetical protein
MAPADTSSAKTFCFVVALQGIRPWLSARDMLGRQERMVSEYRAPLAKAGFRLTRVIPPFHTRKQSPCANSGATFRSAI